MASLTNEDATSRVGARDGENASNEKRDTATALIRFPTGPLMLILTHPFAGHLSNVHTQLRFRIWVPGNYIALSALLRQIQAQE